MKNIIRDRLVLSRLSSALWRSVLFGFFLICAMGFAIQPVQAATRTVTNTLDSGAGSLRQTISDTLDNDVIVFDPTIFNTPLTITLSSGQLVVDKSLTIDGASGNVYTPTVNANNASRVFWVGPSINVTINRLNIVNGYRDADTGGAGIYNQGALTVTSSALISNTSTNFQYGGAVYNAFGGTMTISGSQFINNTGYFGGAIYSGGGNNPVMYIRNTTFVSNTGTFGGAVTNLNANLMDIAGSTFISNTASNYGGAVYSRSPLTVTTSTFNNNSSLAGGGGIQDYGTLYLDTSTFFGNSAQTLGGALNVSEGYVMVTNSTFLSNTSAQHGGALNNHSYGMVDVVNSTLQGNYSAAYGGAVSNEAGSAVTLTNSLLTNNMANNFGGAIDNGGWLAIESNTFRNNLTGDSGGAIYLNSAGYTTTVDNSQFISNGVVIGGGGGVVLYGGTLSVTNSTFVSNTAINGGGALRNNGGVVLAVNDTFVANLSTSSNSGAIYNCNTNCYMAIVNNTIVRNSTPAPYAGGITNQGTAMVTNTLLADNSTANCSGNAATASANNLDSGATCGFSPSDGSLNNTEPLLGNIGNYGGVVPTLPLLPGSPAIDAGTCQGPFTPATDARGTARPQLSACDVGAFESRGFTFGTPSGSPQTATINTAFSTPLGVSVNSSYGEPVNGGSVTIVTPGSGASAALSPAAPLTITNGVISTSASANGITGSYVISASAKGINGAANFNLTNQPIMYALTVHVVGNGNVTNTPAGTSFAAGTVVTLTAAPNTGSSFANWSGNASGTNSVITLSMDSAKVVTATFSLNTYTLSTATSGNGSGTVSHVPAGSTFSYGSVVTLTATPNTGSSFANWSAGVNGSGQVVTLTVDSDKHITATFTLNTYTLNTATTGNGSGSVSHVPAGSTFNYGTVITLTATPITGSSFTNWSAGVSGTGQVVTLTMDANKAVTATFTLNTYTLSTATAGNGSGSVSHLPAGTTFNYGTVITLTATPITGSSFTGWSAGVNGAGQVVTLTMDSDKAVTATFTLNTYTLSTATTGNGTGSVSHIPAGTTFNYGTVITLTATPITGSSFTSWSAGVNGSGQVVTLTMDSDKAITATFTLNTYTLNTATAGNGSGSVSHIPAGSTFNYGTVITLTATPITGSSFTSWSAGVNGAGQVVTLTMNADKTVTATFTLNTYTLTTATTGNGSGSVDRQPLGSSFNYGSVVTLTTSANNGSHFSGWSGNASGTNQVITVTMDGDKSITATFTLNTYSLHTATTGNGSGTVSNDPAGSTFNYGTVVILTATHATGSSFTGWSGNSNSANPVITVTMDGDKSITATFTLNTYALSTATTGNGSGSVSHVPAGTTFNYGTLITLTATPITGSTFTNWSAGINGSGTVVTLTMDSDKAVTATFTLNTYTLTTATTGNGTGSVSHIPAGTTFNYGTLITLTATPITGSSFTNWSAGVNGTGQVVTLTMDSDKAVTATFSLNTYTLSTATTGNGSGTVSHVPAGTTFNYGTVITLTATPITGSSFTNWSAGVSGIGNVVTLTMNSDKAVTATFTLNSYTINTATAGNGHGNISQEPAGSSFNYGTVITLTASPITGSSFVDWRGGVNSTNQVVTVTIDSDKLVTATFTLNTYTLTTATTGNGTGTVSNLPPGNSFNYGTVVTLTADAYTGSTFTGWSGNVSGADQVVTVTIDGDKSVTATFTLITYTLDTASDGNGSGSVSRDPIGSSFDYGTVITLTATPSQGSSFANWSAGCVASGNTCVLSMTGNILVTATFTLNSYTLTMTVEGNGTVSPTAGAHSYLYGSVISLTATPDAGWNFAGWSGGSLSSGDRTNPVSITLLGDTTISATFSAQPVADAGPSRSVKSNTQVTLDGSNSTSIHMPLTYQWAQSGGQTVLLSSTTISQPVFSAPSVVSLTQTLTFTLVVTDQLGFTSPADEVVITITPYLVNMPIIYKP